ncbi:hypothetical protein EVAR_6781_1 [Eumeta japonica]|uniref:Uncharacterized protein n=1 Tax=Eumeta variegata TaxID=151549 RepID=A0A4C1V3N9_EUMVA|nr:hypothetical protein EVAR_6781_1 [Eumeta japonica]
MIAMLREDLNMGNKVNVVLFGVVNSIIQHEARKGRWTRFIVVQRRFCDSAHTTKVVSVGPWEAVQAFGGKLQRRSVAGERNTRAAVIYDCRAPQPYLIPRSRGNNHENQQKIHSKIDGAALQYPSWSSPCFEIKRLVSPVLGCTGTGSERRRMVIFDINECIIYVKVTCSKTQSHAIGGRVLARVCPKTYTKFNDKQLARRHNRIRGAGRNAATTDNATNVSLRGADPFRGIKVAGEDYKGLRRAYFTKPCSV